MVICEFRKFRVGIHAVECDGTKLNPGRVVLIEASLGLKAHASGFGASHLVVITTGAGSLGV